MKNKTIILIQILVMSLIFVLLCGVGAAVVSKSSWGNNFMFSFGDWANTDKLDMTQTKSFNNIKDVKVDAVSYSIYVEEHEGSDVIIEEYVNNLEASKNNEIYSEGGTAYYKQKKSFGIININYGKIVIKVPKGSILDYDIDTVSGTIELDTQSKNAQLKSTSGSVKVYKAGDELEVDCVSGSIKVYASFKEIDSESISGSVKLTADKNTKRVKAKSVSGSVKIALRDEVGYTMKYSTVSGSVRDEYSGAKYGDKGSGTGSQGDKSISIDAASISGSIRLTDWE